MGPSRCARPRRRSTGAVRPTWRPAWPWPSRPTTTPSPPMSADMTFVLTDEQRALKTAVYDLCKQYPAEYWRDLDAKREYPEAFVNELTKAGYLAVLIPDEYGGGGLGLMEAALILEEIGRAGGNPAACHAQMYIMGTVLRHGTDAQKREYLPKIAAGELRLQAFGVTEPNAGSDTTKLQ